MYEMTVKLTKGAGRSEVPDEVYALAANMPAGMTAVIWDDKSNELAYAVETESGTHWRMPNKEMDGGEI